eukprot:ANDGO_03186.mRNA.1 Phospholipase B-like protein B
MVSGNTLLCLATVVLLVAVSVSHGQQQQVSASCYYQGDAAHVVFNKIDHSAVAWAQFADTTFEIGWSKLQLVANPSADASQQSYCAGYLEGALTANATYNLYRTTLETFFPSGTVPSQLNDFFTQQKAYTDDLVSSHASSGDAYYALLGQVGVFYDGFLDGYNMELGAEHPLTYVQLQLVNAEADLGDILSYLFPSQRIDVNVASKAELELHLDAHTHCSALISLLPGHSALLAGHSTWAGYDTMLRTYKYYSVPSLGATIVLSGYPGGGPFSSDDFYMTQPHNLFITETTNDVFDSSLYKKITVNGLLCWQRTLLANALATTGAEWHTIFQRYSAGTYNNQWMVIDYKLFTPGMGSLREMTLTVGEQMPGFYMWADQSAVLEKQGYWPSYNIPFYPEVYNMSGYAAAQKTMGDLVSYTKCPRAQIFGRDRATVKDQESMNKLLRYNNWQSDPLSLNSPSNAIMARNDLLPASAHRRLSGGIDTKTTNDVFIKQLRAQACAGPTHDQQSVFVWSEYEKLTNQTYPHYGQPDSFPFTFVDFQWSEI